MALQYECPVCGEFIKDDYHIDKSSFHYRVQYHKYRHEVNVRKLLWDALSDIFEDPSTSISDKLRRQGLEAIETAQAGGRKG